MIQNTLKKNLLRCLALTALSPLMVTYANANLIITGTRFIYPSQEQAISVDIHNPDPTPSLAQSWLEHGDSTMADQKIPFIITPGIVRVDPDAKLSLRIRHTGETLPKDRESLFYLNILDIPANPKNAESQNYLQFTFRNKLKFFYRPKSLPYAAIDAYDKVVWQLSDQQITIDNKTPYYMNYIGFNLYQGDQMLENSFSDVNMLPPFSKTTVEIQPELTLADTVEWHLINDFGGHTSGKAKLNHAK